MKPLLTPAQMYDLEKRHFAADLPTLTAMENASAAFVDELAAFCGSLSGKRIHVACGSGNNAGDGYAAARLAAQAGAHVTLIPVVPIESLRGDALINARRAACELHLPCISAAQIDLLGQPDIWVDALFGIGLNRPVAEPYSSIIQRINRDRNAGSMVASIDIPSGLNAESGRIEGVAVCADLTITFQHAKTGHYLLDGMDLTGKLVVRDIGMNKFMPESPALLIEPIDPCIAFPRRRHNSHKGTYGHLLVVAGSFGMTGAAMYAASAALRTGAGLVTIACPRSIVPMLQMLAPAAMCIPLPEQDGAVCADALPVLQSALRDKNAVVVGPGLSRRAAPGIVRCILESELPTVVDADALNLIADHPELRALLRPHHVLTPHPGEAARLCPDCTSHPLQDAEQLATLNAVALLKGAATVIRGSEVYISASGSPGMATGGSGDVLSGILGALLAAGVDPERAAWCASELHGHCGELAEQRQTAVSLTAADLISELPSAIARLYSQK